MKRILSTLLTFTLMAGLMVIPAVAGNDAQDGNVIYINDFSDVETDNRCFLTNGSISDGVLRYNRGGGVIFTDENVTSRNDALGVKVHEPGEEKPDIKVEYSITMPTYASAFANNARYVTSNFGNYFYGIDTVDISTYNIWPGKKEASAHYTRGEDIALLDDGGKVYGKTYNIKILYSAKEDIKTIYINDVCLGTYNLKTDYSGWKNNTTGYFKLGFTFAGTVNNSWKSEDREIKIDNVKISKLESKMVSVSLTAPDKILPAEHSASLWVPENEYVKYYAVKPSEGKQLSVSLNGDVYIDSFASQFEYNTPALKENDSIVIISEDKETDFAAYTMPKVYQRVLSNDAKAFVVLGRMVNVEGYYSDSYGIFYSTSDENVTVGGENVHVARLKRNSQHVIDGHFAVEMISGKLKPGDKIYYKAYAYYTNESNPEEKKHVFGEIRTIVIE